MLETLMGEGKEIMNVVDTIFEETIDDRKRLVEKAKTKALGCLELRKLRVRKGRDVAQGYSNRKLIKAIQEDALGNLQLNLNKYKALLNEKLEKAYRDKLVENEERFRKKYSNIEHLNFFSNRKVEIEIFKSQDISLWIVLIALGTGLVVNNLTITLVGWIVAHFVWKNDRKKIRENIKIHCDELNQKLEKFTFEYCKEYEENLNRAIEFCNETEEFNVKI